MQFISVYLCVLAHAAGLFCLCGAFPSWTAEAVENPHAAIHPPIIPVLHLNAYTFCILYIYKHDHVHLKCVSIF